MTVLITMAGLGSRFAREGYTVPKYKVRARGRTLFEWSLLSLSKFFNQKFVLVILKGEDESWLSSTAIELGISDVCILTRETLSSGQAETAFDALDGVDSNEVLWIYNIDTYVKQGISPADIGDADGCLHVFKSNHPGMSYVHYDEKGLVDRVVEKSVISDWATAGIYGFRSVDAFSNAYTKTFESGTQELINGERYVAPMYQSMIDLDKKIVAPRLDLDSVKILGTPKQVLEFDINAKAPKGNW